MPAPSRISVVTARGQVSIPAELRKELALGKGRRPLWEKVGPDGVGGRHYLSPEPLLADSAASILGG